MLAEEEEIDGWKSRYGGEQQVTNLVCSCRILSSEKPKHCSFVLSRPEVVDDGFICIIQTRVSNVWDAVFRPCMR